MPVHSRHAQPAVEHRYELVLFEIERLDDTVDFVRVFLIQKRLPVREIPEPRHVGIHVVCGQAVAEGRMLGTGLVIPCRSRKGKSPPLPIFGKIHDLRNYFPDFRPVPVRGPDEFRTFEAGAPVALFSRDFEQFELF
jgi:hypothetical protein